MLASAICKGINASAANKNHLSGTLYYIVRVMDMTAVVRMAATPMFNRDGRELAGLQAIVTQPSVSLVLLMAGPSVLFGPKTEDYGP